VSLDHYPIHEWLDHLQQEEGLIVHEGVAIAMGAALVVVGAGKWAIDGLIARRLEVEERASQHPMREAA
jgi:hypothetical protein